MLDGDSLRAADSRPVEGVSQSVGETLGAQPGHVRAVTDPGGETQRNFRYQNAYGVMLLLAGKQGKRPYVAIWCEHHEDLLAERDDGRFDAYQVKTSRPESGAWRMLDREVVRSVGRFVELVTIFGEHIESVYFVSNKAYEEVTATSTDTRKRANCPRPFLEHVRTCETPANIQPPFDDTFSSLRARCGCDAELLHSVLRRMELVPGPSRDDFEAVVALDHIGSLPECQGLGPRELAAHRDRLVDLVARASALQVTDPTRHLRSLLEGLATDGPTSSDLPDSVLGAKRIAVNDVAAYVESRDPSTFQFPGSAAVVLGDTHNDTTRSVLRQKLEQGGVDGDQINDLIVKERATEAHLISEGHRDPERQPKLLRQLEAMVLGECRESYLRLSFAGDSDFRAFGAQMLIDMQDRLRALAEERPHMVGDQEYECLMGMVALLTSDCQVWWSQRFVLQGDVA